MIKLLQKSFVPLQFLAYPECSLAKIGLQQFSGKSQLSLLSNSDGAENSQTNALNQSALSSTRMFNTLNYLPSSLFASKQRQLPKLKSKERKTSIAITDEKAAKIADTSKKKDGAKKVDTRPPIATFDKAYEYKKT